MRRKDREITNPFEIEKILSQARFLHLGMLDGDFPYVVPLHYGYRYDSGKLIFYVHCAKEGHKLDCISKNNKVFVEIDCGEKLVEAEQPCRFGAEYASVMGRGTAQILDDPKDKSQALRVFMKTQTGKNYEIREEMTQGVVVVEIRMDSYTAKARRAGR